MTYWIFAFFGHLFAYGPSCIPQAVCWFFGNLIYYLLPRRRRIILSNLHHAFPHKPEKWRRRTARVSCQRLVEMALFSMANTYFPNSRIPRLMHADPKHYALLNNSEPTVGVAPHLSLMEAMILAPSQASDKVKEIGIIYRPLKQPSIDKLVKRSRERFGIKLLSRKQGFMQAIQILKRNGSVGILFDQNAGNRGVLSLFFNRPAFLTDLPGVLAERFKARLIAFNFVREKFWRVRVEPVELLPYGHTKNDLEITFIINEWFENLLKTSEVACEDWMWSHDRWRCLDIWDRRFQVFTLHNSNRWAETLAFKGLKEIPRTTRHWIRLPNWLGDVVMMLPLIRAIRDNRPDAEITFVGQPHLVKFFTRLGLNEKSIYLPKKGFLYYAKVFLLRYHYPDLQIQFTNSLRSDIEAYLIRARERFGIERPGKRRPLLTHRWKLPVAVEENTIHQTKLWQRYLQYFGLPTQYELNLEPFKWQAAPRPDYTDQVIIGIICGTENFSEKRWPVEQWKTLIREILKLKPQARIHLFGTIRDLPITQTIEEDIGSQNVSNLAGKTSLETFADELSYCDVVVSNDTGGMHLANALGIPTVAIYGPTNPIRTGPIFKGKVTILQPEGCPATGGFPIEKVEPNAVLQATLATLETAQALKDI